MSGRIVYPNLFADTESEPASPREPPRESAPPQESEQAAALARMDERHARLCALCRFAVKEKTLHCVLRCEHLAHYECVAAASKIGEIKCEHCLERNIAGLQSDINVDVDRCMRILKEESARKFKSGNYDAVVDEQVLGEEDIDLMLGKRQRISTSILDIFYKKNGEAEPEKRLPLYGAEFVDAMRENHRSIDDIFATLRYTIAHVWNAGVQTMDDLRKIGFDPVRHLTRKLRAVFPIHFLVERYQLGAKDFDTMTNEQFAACDFDRNEIAILGVDANFLTARKFGAAQLAQMKSMKLDDWIGYAGLHVSHAIAMGFRAADVKNLWPSEMKFNERAHVFYVDLHTTEAQSRL